MWTMSEELGPRRTALLSSWGDHIVHVAAGPGFDLTDSNRTWRTQARTDAFLEEGTEAAFRELWTNEILTDAVYGGPNAVLKRFDTIGDLVELIAEIADSSTYDPDWESHFLAATAVWELYGRLHPEQAPILNSECNTGLKKMGLDKPRSYSAANKQWTTFKQLYTEIVGHATAGTDHEVPLHHEMSEFLEFAATTPEEDLIEILGESSDEYAPIIGWETEGKRETEIEFDELSTHIEGYVSAKLDGGLKKEGPKDLWNQGHWEHWKDELQDHIETSVKPNYDIRELGPRDVEDFIAEFSAKTSLSGPVTAHMLGGQQGGILWHHFKTRSAESPSEAAEVLSYLFQNEVDIDLRLDRFAKFYRTESTGPGQLISLPTLLLMFVYPQEYIFYKWSLMNGFFGEFSEYSVETGFNTRQYERLNRSLKVEVLPRLQKEMRKQASDTPLEISMLDVHSLLYILREVHLGE